MYLAAPSLYDWPEIRRDTNACWHLIADALRASGVPAPRDLTRDRSLDDLWRDHALLFGQTCGYPYVTRLRRTVQLVGTPCYAVDGCEGPSYKSFLVVRRDHADCTLEALRGHRVAVNAQDSQSGYSALRHLIAPLARHGWFFGDTVITGSHRASMRAVAHGHADLCAVDAVCWELAARHDPAIRTRLRVVAETYPAPGLPLICARSIPDDVVDRLRSVVSQVLNRGLPSAIRHALCIAGIQWVPDLAYNRILEMETEAAARGFPELDWCHPYQPDTNTPIGSIPAL